MTGDAVKVCPSCETEYQPWATRCADCDVPLDGTSPVPDEPEPAADPDHPPFDMLRPVRTAPMDWLRRLRTTLADAGVRSWIYAEEKACGADHQHGKGCGTRIALWVHTDDLPQALEVDAEHERAELPDLASAPVGEDVCPACGEPCPPHALECAACGLAFPE